MDQGIEEKIFIRLITQEDVEAVEKLITKVMAQFDCIGEGYSINDPEVQDMYSAYSGSQSAFYVIDNGKEILGCGGIAPLKNGKATVCELRKMYFYQALRGKGFGKKLLTLLIERAQDLGYKQMYLETVERMEAANKLYQKNGFKALCTNKGDTGHVACDLYYIKDL